MPITILEIEHGGRIAVASNGRSRLIARPAATIVNILVSHCPALFEAPAMIRRSPFVSALLCSAVLLLIGSTARCVWSQPPILKPPGEGDTLARLPDDQIEGTIWEYKGKPKFNVKAGEKKPELEGRFRVEDEAIFAVSRRVKVPGPGDLKERLEDLRGEGGEVDLPEGAQQKRIGEYSKLSKGRIRMEFDDEKSLHGIMVLKLKKDTTDVWIGEYTEIVDEKKGRKWDIELRPIED
jgi:hypothetical protein